jgi:hypothetical protein
MPENVNNAAGETVAVVAGQNDAIWEALCRPFAADEIEKLPKTMRRDDQDRGTCAQGSRYSADGFFCGKYHARAIHLDYVGHAGITMRLNDVLGPEGWDFRPYATTPEGLPLISASVFYASLTILGVTKWDMAANFNGPQEAYGDALRRCAMRFGVGTYLWSKSDTAAALADQPPLPTPQGELVSMLQSLTAAQTEDVKQNWPYPGREPMDLTADECENVRAVVAMVKGDAS